MRTAFEIARTGRPGPVVVDIPKDIQNWEGVFSGSSRLPIPGYRRRLAAVGDSQLESSKCQEFFDMLAESRRPLIYAGGGVIKAGASEQLNAFGRTLDIPVVTTLMGIGSFDSRHPLSMGMLGMHGAAHANYAVDDCDFLIAIGARFDDRVAGDPSRFAPKARAIAHFDVDPSEIHKVKRVQWSHVGDLTAALESLMAYGREIGFTGEFAEWLKEAAELKRTYRYNYDRESPLIQPQHVVEVINQLTSGEAIISTGVGQHQMWAAQYFDFGSPRLWLTSGSMGTMGVMNNFGDGMVKQWQKLFFKGRLSASDKSLHKKDFVKTAEADGFIWAKRLERKDDVEPLIQEFIGFKGPAFLEVMIDPDAGVYPMVGPGQSYEDMITGDFIPTREAPGPRQSDGPDESGMF
jgi:acetolactate synthase-1/2/3 large subunit